MLESILLAEGSSLSKFAELLFPIELATDLY
jgi:hypothetical protein